MGVLVVPFRGLNLWIGTAYLLLLNWYLLGVNWYLLEVFSKFSDEHPHHFYRGVPPLPPGNLAYQKDVFFFYLADISYACHQDLRR